MASSWASYALLTSFKLALRRSTSFNACCSEPAAAAARLSNRWLASAFACRSLVSTSTTSLVRASAVACAWACAA
eukprot:CAMPEP_0119503932 /NCGR_PEP_ID=MMETSP1344-20130328/24948_1 /TAXON_ID=236787 /ORGANISM="Florenciella parvula, Strain CCMP2471" /LENGTH=74 /DNA_ID=CAMNT_0007540265 /DNA_START=123 /DNA_END=343 /DNA_ORIENTATION=+